MRNAIVFLALSVLLTFPTATTTAPGVTSTSAPP